MPDKMTKGSTDLFFAEKMLFDLFSVARKDSPEKGLYGDINYEERDLIRYILKKIVPVVDDSFIQTIEKNYEGFSGFLKEIRSGNGAAEDITSEKLSEKGISISPMYEKFLDFHLRMDFSQYEGRDFKKKHAKLVKSLLGYFNIRSSEQVDYLDKTMKDIKEGKDSDALQNLESKLNPESGLSRTVIKNFVWDCYSNDGQMDNIETDIANNFGEALFGYKPEDIYEIGQEMLEENKEVRKYSENPSLLNSEAESGLEADVQKRLHDFIDCARFALADNVISNEEDALLWKTAKYFGVREREVYEKLVDYAREELEEDKKQGKFNVLVVNGDQFYTRVISGQIQKELKDSVYTFDFSSVKDGAEAFRRTDPQVLFVDPSYEEGKKLIDSVVSLYPDKDVYALMSRGKLPPGSEAQKAEELGVKGCFHVQRMFPYLPIALKHSLH